ncbi:MAG: hypothetical protein IBJ18_12580 [Phycisphaerales bacterium]|nr:hypothetical protein [Phycisphaerales bacterium]
MSFPTLHSELIPEGRAVSRPVKRTITIILACTIAAAITLVVLDELDTFTVDFWDRKHPLVNPLAVTSVESGRITLADGRVLTPAGIRRRDNITDQQFDDALRTCVAQGVIINRDLKDGRAFLTVEPKFYNWCGTCARKRGSRKRWKGTYFQAPLSELLVVQGYAHIELDQPNLTPLERWRLEGTKHLNPPDKPNWILIETPAFRYDTTPAYMLDYDDFLEIYSKPPKDR